MTQSLLNVTQLADKMGKSPAYVTAMKAAGYVFEYGNQTTFRHALRWRKKHPGFRSTAYFRAHRLRSVDAPGEPSHKSGEPVRSNGR
jgi:hypothetical protein